MSLRSAAIRAWLRPTLTDNGSYRHLHVSEVPSRRKAGREALASIVDEAHRDQRACLAALLEPLDPEGRPSPGAGLVDLSVLHTITLQGYLGEILAGVLAENYDSHGRSWEVPGFTFRFDQEAETQIVRYLCGQDTVAAFGRHGHDCLAFSFDDAGGIDGYLACEGKCSAGHNSALINRGHQQLGGGDATTADILRLLQVLNASETPPSRDWASAFQAWLLSAPGIPDAERCDLLVYLCGKSPQPPRKTWMSTTTPSEKYTGGRKLEAAEAHISRIGPLVVTCYPGHVLRHG